VLNFHQAAGREKEAVMKKALHLFIYLIFAFAAACGPGGKPTQTYTPAPTYASTANLPFTPTITSTPANTSTPISTPTLVPTATLPPPATGPVEIRWFVGLGAGSSENQQFYERNVVYKFNLIHPKIKLTLQVADTINRASELLSDQFSNGKGPDIIGPMGWQAYNIFPDQWLDLSALIDDTHYDVSIFQPEWFAMYKTDAGQSGMPLGVYPAAVFYNTSLFDAAKMAYPPDAYGKPYRMPDGSDVEWNWDTLADVARHLTLDAQGRNATKPDFDATHIVQYGFIPQWVLPTSFASFWEANQLYDQDNHAVIPPAWKKAWEWYYDGMWGAQPFIPNQPALNTAHFGHGGAFNTDYCAMAISQSWYIGAHLAGGQHWDFGALPSTNGIVHGRIDADTLRIWKGAPHPREAFEVLTYLLGPAYAELMRAYESVPAITAYQDAFFREQSQKYLFVRNWDVLRASLNYPDIPSGEGYIPNFTVGWDRMNAFGNLLASNGTISMEAEIETLRHDLEAIFHR
jgi:multiple sugar transport system substrate-binding protein